MIFSLVFQNIAKKTGQALVILLLVLLSSPVCAGDATLPPFSARVSINVAANKDIKALIESYMGRELRELGDVVVVGNRPDWVLNIVAMNLKNQAGHKAGFGLSAVVLKPFERLMIQQMIKPEYRVIVYSLTEGLYEFRDHLVEVGGKDDLRSICSDIVAEFDSRQLNPARSIYQEIIDKQEGQKSN